MMLWYAANKQVVQLHQKDGDRDYELLGDLSTLRTREQKARRILRMRKMIRTDVHRDREAA